LAIWCVSEFDNTLNRKEVGAIKEFMTLKKVTIRRPYDRRTTEGYRVCSFVASVNDDEFLRDRTGNRRYLVFDDTSNLKPDHNIEISQLAAQCVKEWQNGFNIYTSREENERLTEINNKYLMRTTVDMWINSTLKDSPSPKQSMELFKSYGEWCIENGCEKMSVKMFGTIMTARFASKEMTAGKMYFAEKTDIFLSRQPWGTKTGSDD
jgi:hypothetical protein